MENKTTNQNNSADIITLAVEKIKEEFEHFSGGTKEKAVSSYVSTILQDFCKQDERFATVIYQFKRTLSDCCKDIMQGVTSHISDIDVYRSAVKFYFPNSEISMNMKIEITGDAPADDEILKEAPKPKEKSKKPAVKKETPQKAKTETPAPVNKKKPTKTEEKQENTFIQLSLL